MVGWGVGALRQHSHHSVLACHLMTIYIGASSYQNGNQMADIMYTLELSKCSFQNRRGSPNFSTVHVNNSTVAIPTLLKH